jgi:glycosyltransferase involved in cell wall biosynthesis
MKLLIVTQVVDTEHPILAFFHRWIEEFAKHCEHVHVICLEEGVHSLPANVSVHSLGKEIGRGRLGILLQFYRLIWNLRKDYDSVFVHMNQIYVILGAPFWRTFGKKVGLWYAHGSTPRTLVWAEKMTDIVFTASEDSFKVLSKKVLVPGHGIDTKHFTPLDLAKKRDLITVGRITLSKNLTALIEIVEELQKIQLVTLSIVGVAVTEIEKQHDAELKKLISEKGLGNVVEFVGKVSQKDLPKVLGEAKVFVTTAQNGSLDKAMLEAMACGLPVVSMAPGSVSLPFGDAQTTTKEAFFEQVKKVLESGVFEKPEYVEYVRKEHSIKSLTPKITQRLS